MTLINNTLKNAIDRQQIPGCVAMVVDAQSTLYHGAFGVRGIDTHTPMTIDTVFRLASMTKAFTSIAAMQLVEAGKLKLDQPVSELLPEFAQLKVLTGFYGDNPALRAPARPATLRHLLTHTSGLAYQFWHKHLTRWVDVTKTPAILDSTYAGLMTPLVDDPGAMWMYGSSTDWAGRVIEVVTGKTLDVVFDEALCGPLGLADTRFVANDAMRARMAGAMTRNESGQWSPFAFEWPAGNEYWNGGHRLLSTAPDYARFVQALLNRGTFDNTKILRGETVDLINQNHIGELFVTNLETVAPAFVCDAEFFPGMRKKHGLAYMLNEEDCPGRRAAGSGYWAGAFNTFFWLDPKNKIGAVLMMQLLPFADPVIMQVLDQFEAAVYATFRR